MYCSVFFAFDNGVITLLVQMGLSISPTSIHPCSPSLKPGQKRENCDQQKFICIRK